MNDTAACVLGIMRMGPPPPAMREPGPEAMTGWQVLQTAQQSLARFWSLTLSQIYLELGRLEAAGLVETVGETGPRASRPYRITERVRGQIGPEEDREHERGAHLVVL